MHLLNKSIPLILLIWAGENKGPKFLISYRCGPSKVAKAKQVPSEVLRVEEMMKEHTKQYNQ